MKVVVEYSNGEKDIVYNGKSAVVGMKVQAFWVERARKNNEIISVGYE